MEMLVLVSLYLIYTNTFPECIGNQQLTVKTVENTVKTASTATHCKQLRL